MLLNKWLSNKPSLSGLPRVLSQGIILVSDQDKDSETTKSSILFQGCYKMSDFLLWPAESISCKRNTFSFDQSYYGQTKYFPLVSNSWLVSWQSLFLV